MRLVYAFIPGQFETTIRAIETPIAKAATAALSEARSIILSEGRAAISSAGFSRRWQNIFRSRMTPKRGGQPVINASVTFFDNSFFINLFGEGGTHHGKPLMWLPLDTVPFGSGHTRLTPKQYQQRVGKLFSVRRAGRTPLLVGKGTSSTIARATRKAVRFRKRAVTSGSLRGTVNVPLFVGVSSVTIGKKFDVKSIIARVSGQIGELYLKHFQEQK